MPKRQGLDDLGLNLQMRKDNAVEIQNDFYVVIFIESAVAGAVFDDLAISCDENFPRYSRLELRLASTELSLRQSPVVILVESCNLRGVLDRQRQCRLKTVRVLPD